MDKTLFENLLYAKLLKEKVNDYFECESFALHIQRYNEIKHICWCQAYLYIDGIRDKRIEEQTLRFASQIESALNNK